MTYFLIFLLFILGASFGSFIGAHFWRQNNTVINPQRSQCDMCGRKLSWYELIPILSTLFLYFKKSIKCQCSVNLVQEYFALEIVGGLLMSSGVLYVYKLANPYFIYIFPLMIGGAYCLLTLSYEDYKTKSVTAGTVYLYLFVSIINFLVLMTFGATSIYNLLIPIVLTAPFFAIVFISREKALGLGDPLVLLSTLLLFSSFSGSDSLNIFLYTIWTGALTGILYLYIKYGELRAGVSLPFIPFIVLGTLLLLITRFNVIEVSDILMIWQFLVS